MENISDIMQSVNFLQRTHPVRPSLGIVLGSGWGDFGREIPDALEIPYEDIPHFPISTVAGHAGKLVLGMLEGKALAVMAGRFHYYEGYSLAQVVLPTRVLAKLGITDLIVTNAAGGINAAFAPGDLMLIDDHINLMGTNPLIGYKDWEPRFPDMTTAYTPRLRSLCKKVAAELHIPLRQGVYLATTGPSFETPAEIRMMRSMGADAVGMSTVPEVITARQMGISVLGISCITNMAAGIIGAPITHEEVQETATKVRDKFVRLLHGIIAAI